ncbi:MAG: UDP-glucose--hexose-1-phosphate uridylyltransferase [Christensenellales bacterium]
MNSVLTAIEKLLAFGLCYALIEPLDVPHVRNALLDALSLSETTATGTVPQTEGPVPETATPILRPLLDYAVSHGLIEDTVTARTLLDTRLMGCLMPRPSEIAARFEALRNHDGIAAATDWFYDINRRSNYIRVDDVARSLEWPYESGRYGRLKITINLSKPEKDPREIAQLRTLPRSAYPACPLCLDNVGYAGRLDHPARQTLRVLPLTLNRESWFFQYSPYVYYDHHCIVFKREHTPMHIDRNTFIRLLEFTEQFPHYFIGSNAGLPIVGGSILNHDHFQGGASELPMARAAIDQPLVPPSAFPGTAAILRWPMSVVRLGCDDPEALVEAGDRLLAAWQDYSDPGRDIIARSPDGTLHNAVTPIVRRRAGRFELDLVLRNNRTSAEHPMGIFHPHAELHHIKKENIGLIEAMGLFILPGRLENELAGLSDVLTSHAPLDERTLEQPDHPLCKHLPWLRAMVSEYGTSLSQTEAAVLLRREVGRLCVEILRDAGVFKDTLDGREGFLHFLESAGYVAMR